MFGRRQITDRPELESISALNLPCAQNPVRLERAINERSDRMQQDPFGNLMDWGPVLDRLEEFEDKQLLADNQPGLIRILKYKGNWRLREEVLRRISQIENPCEKLIQQVLAILADDNLYYDVRILASNALIELLQNTHDGFHSEMSKAVKQVVDRLMAVPQPPNLDRALNSLRMVLPQKIQGICCTCEKRMDCRILTQSQAKGDVIWHCEEFDDPATTTREEDEKHNPVVMSSDNLIPGWKK